jgi:ribonuclease BN (tRNA processing enzyme)
MHSTRVIFLGTGDAFSPGGRRQAAYVIESPESSLLLDCGATILISLRGHGITAEPIDVIFLSHYHGDHIAGLPFLFLHYLYIEPRSRPLKIVGPPGVEDKVMAIFRAMYAETATEPLPFKLEFIEAQPRKQFRIKDVGIIPFPVPHQSNSPSFGCEIDAGGRKIVYSGDTGWTENLVAHTQNADLFICECSFFDTRAENHMDYLQITEQLSRFGAKRIVLSHIGQEVLDRRKDVELEIAHDGLIVDL